MSNYSKSYLFLVYLFLTLSFSWDNSFYKKNDDVKVEMITSKGKIVIRLYSKTEKHKNNFINLINCGFFEGVLFHRVINNFVAQAGDPNSKIHDFNGKLGEESHGETIPAEFFSEYYHKKGVIAAARNPDNVNPLKASSGSQFYLVQGKIYTELELNNLETKINLQNKKILLNKFFIDPQNENYTKRYKDCLQSNSQDSINLFMQKIKPVIFQEYVPFKFSELAIKDYTTIGGIPFLDGSYTVYGEVIEGLDVIDDICIIETNKMDQPIEDVKIISIKIIE